MSRSGEQSIARRFFLSRFGIGASVVGATLAGTAAAKPEAEDSRWQSTRHAKDDWFDQIPGQHRLVFDTTTPEGMVAALQFANNFYTANQNEYGLGEKDLAVVVVARHKSTSFGYNDAMWEKYGKNFSEQSGYKDPKTNEAPSVNPHATPGNGEIPPGRMDALLKKGLNLAVCQMATQNISRTIARATGGDADTIFKELGQNLVANARLVPAGIVAVSRAQERGYTFVHGVAF